MKEKRFHHVKGKKLIGYVFILPLTALFGIFIVYPIIYNFIISFYDWNGIDIQKTFIGFKNYATILTDPVILKIGKNFVIFCSVHDYFSGIPGPCFCIVFFQKDSFQRFLPDYFLLTGSGNPGDCGEYLFENL